MKGFGSIIYNMFFNDISFIWVINIKGIYYKMMDYLFLGWLWIYKWCLCFLSSLSCNMVGF